MDFQLTVGRDPVPVEVKSGKLGRIRSLEFYRSRYTPKASFVVCRRSPRIGGEGEYTLVPMYLVWRFGDFAEAAGLRTGPGEVPPLPEWEPPA